MFFDCSVREFKYKHPHECMHVYDAQSLVLPSGESIYTRVIQNLFEQKCVYILYDIESCKRCSETAKLNQKMYDYVNDGIFESTSHFVSHIENGCKEYCRNVCHKCTLKNKDVCDIEITNIILTFSNLVEEAIQYYKQNKLLNTDILETIQAMLESNMYTLGQEFTQNKMDFIEANTLFLASVAPAKLSKNDLQNLIFKSVVCDNLI
jgi:hypothetical protein